MSKAFDLCVGAEYQDKTTGEGKTKWTKIGVMRESSKGGFTIFLDALPLTGRIQAFEQREKEDKQQAQ